MQKSFPCCKNVRPTSNLVNGLFSENLFCVKKKGFKKLKPKKKIPFIKWISVVGVNDLAEALGVDPATVRHWRRGQGFPRVEQMRLIKKLSKGQVGYEQIIDGGSGK